MNEKSLLFSLISFLIAGIFAIIIFGYVKIIIPEAIIVLIGIPFLVGLILLFKAIGWEKGAEIASNIQLPL